MIHLPALKIEQTFQRTTVTGGGRQKAGKTPSSCFFTLIIVYRFAKIKLKLKYKPITFSGLIATKRLAVCAVAVFIVITYQVTNYDIKCTKLSHTCKPAIAYDRRVGGSGSCSFRALAALIVRGH